jgi:hypothetical protein
MMLLNAYVKTCIKQAVLSSILCIIWSCGQLITLIKITSLFFLIHFVHVCSVNTVVVSRVVNRSTLCVLDGDLFLCYIGVILARFLELRKLYCVFIISFSYHHTLVSIVAFSIRLKKLFELLGNQVIRNFVYITHSDFRICQIIVKNLVFIYFFLFLARVMLVSAKSFINSSFL